MPPECPTIATGGRRSVSCSRVEAIAITHGDGDEHSTELRLSLGFRPKVMPASAPVETLDPL